MSLYDINFGNVSNLLLPPSKRKPKIKAWLRALLQPLQGLRDDIFVTYKADILKRIKYTGQTIVLESILNDFYSITNDPFIYIENVTKDNFNAYVGAGSETEMFVGNDGFTNSYIGTTYTIEDTNFIIHVPVGLVFVEAELRDLVDSIKPYGTNYTIETY
jgi:hypothetical protein